MGVGGKGGNGGIVGAGGNGGSDGTVGVAGKGGSGGIVGAGDNGGNDGTVGVAGKGGKDGAVDGNRGDGLGVWANAVTVRAAANSAMEPVNLISISAILITAPHQVERYCTKMVESIVEIYISKIGYRFTA